MSSRNIFSLRFRYDSLKTHTIIKSLKLKLLIIRKKIERNSQGFETESEKSNMTESVSQRGRELRDKFEDDPSVYIKISLFHIYQIIIS